jgi:hypothetical protein
MGIEDNAALALACEADYRIGCLESRLAEVESRLQTAKIVIARIVEINCLDGRINHGRGCPTCGALGDESCDAGLHG